MQIQKQAVDVKAKWVRCPKCGHKLMRVLDIKSNTLIEIKCSSCKAIVKMNIEKE